MRETQLGREIRGLANIQTAALEILMGGGDESVERFLKLFGSEITNANTRESYLRSIADFLRWCDTQGMKDLTAIRPIDVSAWKEQLARDYSVPMIKQRLTSVRYL